MKKFFVLAALSFGLVAPVSAYTSASNGGTELCIYSSSEGRFTHKQALHYPGPGQEINLNGTILRPVGNSQYVDPKGYRFNQERAMNHLVLSHQNGAITCTVENQFKG